MSGDKLQKRLALGKAPIHFNQWSRLRIVDSELLVFTLFLLGIVLIDEEAMDVARI